MFRWPFGMRRHEEDFRDLDVLRSLTDQPDPDETLRLVAEASAGSLPKGSKTGARYLADPARSFGIKEARAGTINGVRTTLVWTDPRVSPVVTGDGDASAGSTAGNTFAFAHLPRTVPWGTVWPRPRNVPVSAGPGTGLPELDERYLAAGDAPTHTFTPGVVAAFVAAPRRTFSWSVLWGTHVCAYVIDAPSKERRGDRVVDFVVSVSRAMDAPG